MRNALYINVTCNGYDCPVSPIYPNANNFLSKKYLYKILLENNFGYY